MDLLHRISSFWRDWESRYQATGWGIVGTALDTGIPPTKFSIYNSGSALPGSDKARGDVVPAVLEWISVPEVEPIPISDLSPRVAQLMSNWESHMLLTDRSLQRGRIHVYEDPLFRTNSGKLGLAKMLFKANMLRFVKHQRGLLFFLFPIFFFPFPFFWKE